MGTSIPWCKETWNPITGCSKITTGCLNCYALCMAYRQKMMGNHNYFNVVDKYMGEICWTGELCFVESALEKPFRWKKPIRIFLGSMSDLLHREVPDEWRDRIFAIMARCPQHTFLATTKRAELMQRYVAAKPYYSPKFILPNLWLGMSVSTQPDLDANIQYLLATRAAVRWISYEPALGPIGFGFELHPPCSHRGCYAHHSHPCEGCGRIAGRRAINWLVIGCESGPNRRPMDIEWAYDAVRQCRDAGVACFVKQLDIGGKVVTNMADFPPDLRVREYPR